MKPHLLLLLSLIVGVAGLATPAQAAEAASSRPSLLREVKALDAGITLSEAKIPLSALLQRVAEQTGAPLAAAPDVADEPVAAVVRAFPARELLEHLSELLDYQWRRRGKEGAWRYEIYQDLASKQREEGLRQALLRDTEKRFREQLQQLAEVAALRPEQFQQLSAEAERHQQEWQKLSPEQQQALLSGPEGREQIGRYTAVRMVQAPVQRALATLLGPLPAREWERLREGGSLTVSSAPRPGEVRLPLAMESRLRAARPSLLRPGARLAFPTPEAEERLRRREESLQEAWASATGYRVHLRLDVRQLASRGSLSLNSYVIPYRSGGAPLAADLPPVGGGGSGIELHVSSSTRDFLWLPEAEPPGRQAALKKDAVLGVPRRFQAETKPNPSTNGPAAPSWWSLRQLLPDLARTYDVHFIADSYWTSSSGLTTTALPAEPAPLYLLLDRATKPNQRWERHDKLIRLRSRTWFLDRPREIPLRMTRHWQALFAERGALPLATCAEIATTLTEPQLETLAWLDDLLGLPPDLTVISWGRHALRCYAALGPLQREALRQERAVPLAQLAPRAREPFIAALEKALSVASGELDPERLALGGFSLEREPFTRVREVRGGVATYREEATGVPASAPDAGAAATPSGTVSPGVSLTRHPVMRLRLRCHYGSERYEAAQFIVATPL